MGWLFRLLLLITLVTPLAFSAKKPNCQSTFEVADDDVSYDVSIPIEKIIEDGGEYWVNVQRLGGRDGEYDLSIYGRSRGRYVTIPVAHPVNVKDGMIRLDPRLVQHIRTLDKPEISLIAQRVENSLPAPREMTDLKYDDGYLVEGKIPTNKAQPKYLKDALTDHPKLKITIDRPIVIEGNNRKKPIELSAGKSAQIREQLFGLRFESKDIPEGNHRAARGEGLVTVTKSNTQEGDLYLNVMYAPKQNVYRPLMGVWISVRNKRGELVGVYRERYQSNADFDSLWMEGDPNAILAGITIPKEDLPEDGYTIEFIAL